MISTTAVQHHQIPGLTTNPGAPRRSYSHHPATLDPATTHRAWDLRAGDRYRGRTIASVHGIMGMGSSPVAVISFTSQDTDHAHQLKVPASYSGSSEDHDDVWLLARAWARSHGLHEGDIVDLVLLRTDVVDAAHGD